MNNDMLSFMFVVLLIIAVCLLVKAMIASSGKEAFQRGEQYARKCLSGSIDDEVAAYCSKDTVTTEDRIDFMQSQMDTASAFGEKTDFDIGVSYAIAEYLELS